MSEKINFENMCPRYEKAMEVMGKKWTGLIIRALMEGPRRFSEIVEYVGEVSDRMLSERLQELEREGIVERRVYDQRPVLVEYTLTKKGHDLRKVLESIQTWANKWENVEEAEIG